MEIHEGDSIFNEMDIRLDKMAFNQVASDEEVMFFGRKCDK